MKKINKIKNEKNKRKIGSKVINKKRGSELVQTMLITAIMVVVIATIFFPQIQGIFTKGMGSISTWFDSALSAL